MLFFNYHCRNDSNSVEKLNRPKGVWDLKFYNLRTKQSFEVPDDQVTVITTKNGRKAGQVTVDGTKFFRFLGKADLEKLGVK